MYRKNVWEFGNEDPWEPSITEEEIAEIEERKLAVRRAREQKIEASGAVFEELYTPGHEGNSTMTPIPDPFYPLRRDFLSRRLAAEDFEAPNREGGFFHNPLE